MAPFPDLSHRPQATLAELGPGSSLSSSVLRVSPLGPPPDCNPELGHSRTGRAHAPLGSLRDPSPWKSPVSATTMVNCLSWSSADSILCRFTGEPNMAKRARRQQERRTQNPPRGRANRSAGRQNSAPETRPPRDRTLPWRQSLPPAPGLGQRSLAGAGRGHGPASKWAASYGKSCHHHPQG